MTSDPRSLEPVDAKTAEALEKKCQENGWLKRGGYAWQDDPYLEEYPYAFVIAPDMDALDSYFESGIWASRQGIVYGDLAFIQQVNGGDEYWTLKNDNGTWKDFESVSCTHMVTRLRADFEGYVASMRAALPVECTRLEYLCPPELAKRLAELSRRFDMEGAKGAFRDYAVEALAKEPEEMEKYLTPASPEEAEPAAQLLALNVRLRTAGRGDGLAARAAESREAAAEIGSRPAPAPLPGRDL